MKHQYLGMLVLALAVLACQQSVPPTPVDGLSESVPSDPSVLHVLVVNVPGPLVVGEERVISWDAPNAEYCFLPPSDVHRETSGETGITSSEPGYYLLNVTCVWADGVYLSKEYSISVTAPEATSTPVVTATESTSPVVKETASNGWDVAWFDGADLDRGDRTTFRSDAEKWNLRKIAPELWPTFPNVPNPLVPEFRVVNGSEVPDGLEYAMDESNFCQQLAGEECRVPVAAMHYLYFTGDYDVPEVGSCSEDGTGFGCMLVIVNVGRVTSDITGMFGQGFRLHARYWNGEALDMAMWGLTSHGANVMMHLESDLNPNGIQNAGANCSVPEGCLGVKVRLLFTSGNEFLVAYETQVER